MPFVQVRQSLPMPSTSAAVPAGSAPASDEVPHILSEGVERESSHTGRAECVCVRSLAGMDAECLPRRLVRRLAAAGQASARVHPWFNHGAACTPAHTPRSMITPPPFDPAQNDGPHGSCRWRDRGSGEEWTWKPGKQTPRAKDAQKLRKQAADRFGLERRERARAQQAQSSVEHSAAVAATPSTTTARTPGTPAEHAVRYESPKTTAKVC